LDEADREFLRALAVPAEDEDIEGVVTRVRERIIGAAPSSARSAFFDYRFRRLPGREPGPPGHQKK